MTRKGEINRLSKLADDFHSKAFVAMMREGDWEDYAKDCEARADELYRRISELRAMSDEEFEAQK